MRREDLIESAEPHSSPRLRAGPSATPEAQIPAVQQSDAIVVTIEMDLPANKVLGPELDLIERHLGDLLQEMLLLDNESEE